MTAPIWLTQDGIVPDVPRRPLPRVRMLSRRAFYWLRSFQWWAILALVAGLVSVALAAADKGLALVCSVAALSITLAVLSTKETP
jgi:hypothetical protein